MTVEDLTLLVRSPKHRSSRKENSHWCLKTFL